MVRGVNGNAKARAFLAAFRLTGSVTRAADAVKIERTLHYRWLKQSGRYASDFRKAADEFADALEGEAIRRANEGVLEPVFYQGKAAGAIRVYSDGLMQFLLKGLKREKYGVAHVAAELSGPGGGPMVVRDAALATLTDDELATLISITRKLEDAGGAGPGATHPAEAED